VYNFLALLLILLLLLLLFFLVLLLLLFVLLFLPIFPFLMHLHFVHVPCFLLIQLLEIGTLIILLGYHLFLLLCVILLLEQVIKLLSEWPILLLELLELAVDNLLEFFDLVVVGS
jgi:hypothetical protein